MIIDESYRDVETKSGLMRVFLFHPRIQRYPYAKFPGVVVFSEIYQVTSPVQRFARQIASQGYICAAPSSYHEFVSSDALSYDGPGTDKGNALKVEKELHAYDSDAAATVDLLLSLKTCNGRIGATGMCLGGHLAYRCAFDSRVNAAFCFFATDIHSETLGRNKQSDSLARTGEIKGEVAMVFGTHDTHVPFEGRTRIRARLEEVNVKSTFLEIHAAQHAFIRDELSKGRYDAAVTKYCFEMLLELFSRRLKTDLGEEVEDSSAPEHVC